MSQMLTRLKIREVSSVDRGAGKGVKVMLMKRRDASPYVSVDKRFKDADLADAVITYLKREFTQAQRDASEAKGHAMQGGSFPIENTSDLENAIQAIGRAKDPDAAKAHIRARAQALGASDKIPDTWGKSLSKAMVQSGDDGVDDLVVSAAGIALAFGVTPADVAKAGTAIGKCIAASGISDPDGVEKSFNQFVDFLKSKVPAENTDAFMAACAAALTKGTQDMPTVEELQKALADSNALIAKQGREIRIIKMSEKHKDYHDKMEAGAAKDKFADMEPGERDDHMEKHPIEKKLAPLTSDDPVIKSLIEKTNKTEAENADLKKRLAAVDEATAVADFKKRAGDLGLPEAHGEIMRKAYAGDPAAIKKHEEMLKGIANQIKTGEVFKEFGSNGGNTGATAYEKLNALAAEYQKTEAGSKMTKQQAFTKVYTDPVNKALAADFKNEEARKRRAA